MINSNTTWILRNGVQSTECVSFPYAFRSLFFIVKKAITDKKPIDTSTLAILGPKNSKGERKTYSYSAAKTLAEEQGLLTLNGEINSKEFKKRY